MLLRLAEDLHGTLETTSEKSLRLSKASPLKSHFVKGKIVRIDGPLLSRYKTVLIDIGSNDGIQLGDEMEIFVPGTPKRREVFSVEECNGNSARGTVKVETAKVGLNVASRVSAEAHPQMAMRCYMQ